MKINQYVEYYTYSGELPSKTLFSSSKKFKTRKELESFIAANPILISVKVMLWNKDGGWIGGMPLEEFLALP